MPDMTLEERRVYTAALMGGVRMEQPYKLGITRFTLAGQDVHDIIANLRGRNVLGYTRNVNGRCEMCAIEPCDD